MVVFFLLKKIQFIRLHDVLSPLFTFVIRIWWIWQHQIFQENVFTEQSSVSLLCPIVIQICTAHFHPQCGFTQSCGMHHAFSSIIGSCNCIKNRFPSIVCRKLPAQQNAALDKLTAALEVTLWIPNFLIWTWGRGSFSGIPIFLCSIWVFQGIIVVLRLWLQI